MKYDVVDGLVWGSSVRGKGITSNRRKHNSGRQRVTDKVNTDCSQRVWFKSIKFYFNTAAHLWEDFQYQTLKLITHVDQNWQNFAVMLTCSNCSYFPVCMTLCYVCNNSPWLEMLVWRWVVRYTSVFAEEACNKVGFSCVETRLGRIELLSRVSAASLRTWMQPGCTLRLGWATRVA